MASDDPYQTLGVSRTADAEEIRKAFRRIAKANHPDLNPGDAAAEARFKAANAAHDLLSDPAKRARFDRGEIDASGQEVPPRGYYRDHAEADQGARYRGTGAGADPFGGMGGGWGGAGGGAGLDPEDLEEILGMFRGGGMDTAPRRGRDARYRLAVDFLDAVNGATRRLNLPDGRDLDVRIPPGLEDGQVLRLRGRGGPGLQGGPDGDALIEVEVRPHPFYARDGRDLRMELPVTLSEAVLGARIPVPTPRGEVMLTIPPRSDAGTQMRLRGRGVAAAGGSPAGDLIVTLRLVLGTVDDRLAEFLRGWKPENPTDPRGEMRRRA
ncbi:J domain-containing protein [Roseomonas sp. SSH11]|uniref:J domain-containing protein n=1 Tax=Pararoseomonas baculiformis TaxID=2820812 RepID=A0ABS4ACC2_9PROT|nr:DnaJ C-terminal domain-containing protein [Pararoseomonas baculiformis]MBP0444659.1 J domain-containing protein [Pararoseomonas baculiformis]